MDLVVIIAASVGAVAHVGFFTIEALLWRKPGVSRLFGAPDKASQEALAPIMYNIGFYNLFVGIGAIVGVVQFVRDDETELLTYALGFMVAAALVLIARSPKMWTGALAQGLAPAVGLVALVLA